jgi:levanase/fructan beta-fructosidase
MDKDFEAVLKKGQNFWIDFGKDNYAGVSFSNVTSKDGGKFSFPMHPSRRFQ